MLNTHESEFTEEIVEEIVEEVISPNVQQIYSQPQPTYVQTRQPQILIQGNYPSILVGYILWFFLGWIGIHHLYIGRGIGVWVLSLFTLQGFFIWWIVDLFLIPGSCTKNRQQFIQM